ncbi:hypothetical protein NDU88_011222 [Pleurodeles waltl]|uniref:Endonuclease/exonuclease/phosphatase domain-containing protein n=1 Tax=Pleurodeles waltl TaxID=8319 RepID=A0AAV7R2G6_PLEWA|nr:hypothetical protein NDU88_011222 [Pleurodeles waltl]
MSRSTVAVKTSFIMVRKNEEVIIFNAYIHPKCKEQDLKQFADQLLMSNLDSPNLILSGDLNLHLLDSSADDKVRCQSLYWNTAEQSRNLHSRTSKTARHLLDDLEHINFRALNGRCLEDSPPVAYFYSATNSSTLDYTFVTVSFFHPFSSFRLGDKGHRAHRPQEMLLQASAPELEHTAEVPLSSFAGDFKKVKSSLVMLDEVLLAAKGLLLAQ